MNGFNPEHFAQSVTGNLDDLGRHMTERGDNSALGLVGNLFELFTEINTNLNRLAVAQEQLVAIAETDLSAAVEQEVKARLEPAVEKAVKETSARSYIGQKNPLTP